MFRYGNGEPGMGKIPDWHPRYQRTRKVRSSVNVVVIFWTKIFIFVKITELFTV